MTSGCVVSSQMAPGPAPRLHLRIFDLDTGYCLRQTALDLPGFASRPKRDPQSETSPLSLLTGTTDPTHFLVVAAGLDDHRVAAWDAGAFFATSEYREPVAHLSKTAAMMQAQVDELRGLVAELWAFHGPAGAPLPPQNEPGLPAAGWGGGERGWKLLCTMQESQRAMVQNCKELQKTLMAFTERRLGSAAPGHDEDVHVFFTPRSEPLADVSTSASQRRIFACGVEHVFVLDLAGAWLQTLSMADWPGIRELYAADEEVDVGPFSWPLPNSQGMLVHLERNWGLYHLQRRLPDPEERQRIMAAVMIGPAVPGDADLGEWFECSLMGWASGPHYEKKKLRYN